MWTPYQKKAGVAILITDRADLKAKKVIMDKQEHHIMIKGSVLQEDIIILNMYMPNKRTSKYRKKKK